MFVLLSLGAVLILWSTWGYVSSRVEQAEYRVLSKAVGYEVRRYPARVVAETRIPGAGTKALNEGFKIVAAYIFGANTKDARIAMTAPVIAVSERGNAPEKSFTATFVEGDTTVAFGMPKDIASESLPFPIDPRVTIVTVPETTYAVLSFRGFRSDERIQAKERTLLERIAANGLKPAGSIVYAGYDAPGTPPWLTRHEVMVPIAS